MAERARKAGGWGGDKYEYDQTCGINTSFTLKYDHVLAHSSNVSRKKEMHFLFMWSQADADRRIRK